MFKDYNISFDEFLKNFKNHITKLNLKNTIQKDYILKVLYHSKSHLSAQEISNEIKESYRLHISIATIYKTLNFLEELNMVDCLEVTKKAKKYELNLSLHHDHLICTSCHKIIEFNDEIIEDKQILIASKNNFKLTNHTMIIYGLCSNCQNSF